MWITLSHQISTQWYCPDFSFTGNSRILETLSLQGADNEFPSKGFSRLLDHRVLTGCSRWPSRNLELHPKWRAGTHKLKARGSVLFSFIWVVRLSMAGTTRKKPPWDETLRGTRQSFVLIDSRRFLARCRSLLLWKSSPQGMHLQSERRSVVHAHSHSHTEPEEGEDIWKTPFRSNETGIFLSSERQMRGPFTLLRDRWLEAAKKTKDKRETRRDQTEMYYNIYYPCSSSSCPLGPSLLAKVQNTY